MFVEGSVCLFGDEAEVLRWEAGIVLRVYRNDDPAPDFELAKEGRGKIVGGAGNVYRVIGSMLWPSIPSIGTKD